MTVSRLRLCMNSRLTSFICVAALLSIQYVRPAYGQTEEDLLSGLPTEEPTAASAPSAKKEESPKAAAKKAEADSEKAAEDKAEAAEKQAKKKKEELESRKDIIKSVQRRPVLKKHRLELSAFGAMTINDPLYLTFALQGSAHFFLAESLSIGVGIAYLFDAVTLGGVADVRRSERAVPSIFERPNMAGTIEMTFNPLYGKVSFHNAAIGHIDTYLIGGFGGVFNFHKTGRPAGVIGIGQRFNLLSWLNIKWELRDYIFNDTIESNYGTNSDIQNYFMLNIGVGFFIPPTFSYKIR